MDDFTAGNKEHFDRQATNYKPSKSALELPKRYALAQFSKDYTAQPLDHRAADAVVRHADLDGDKTELMDFACGAGTIWNCFYTPWQCIINSGLKGLLSQRLAPHVKSILGVDISQGMVDLYNTFVQNQGIKSEEMQAICIDLLSSSQATSSPLDGRLFDIVVVSVCRTPLKPKKWLGA